VLATNATVKMTNLSDDGLRVELVIDGLQRGHVHHLVSKGVRSAEGALPLLHSDA